MRTKGTGEDGLVKSRRDYASIEGTEDARPGGNAGGSISDLGGSAEGR
jgi:hypothetical protein